MAQESSAAERVARDRTIEEIVSMAQARGFDPERVRQALSPEPAPGPSRAVAAVKLRSRFARLVARQ
jgi:hypothetical protein